MQLLEFAKERFVVANIDRGVIFRKTYANRFSYRYDGS